MKEEIKVGFCVAYDWYLLKYSLPLIYNLADKICLSVDNERRSWNNLSYQWDEEGFWQLIKEIDKDNKVDVYQDNFHIADLTPMENEVRQRNMMAKFMGEGGWHVQLDSDEYFLEFDEFVKFLHSLPKRSTRKANVCCPVYTLFKKVEGGFLLISADNKKSIEYFTIASKEPFYEFGRKNSYFNIIAPMPILHQSWSRSEEEIQDKLKNWGHVGDYEPKEFLQFWKGLNSDNYKDYKNFHPINPEVWSKFVFIRAESINELIKLKEFPVELPPKGLRLAIKNSKNISRIKSIFIRISKLVSSK